MTNSDNVLTNSDNVLTNSDDVLTNSGDVWYASIQFLPASPSLRDDAGKN